MYKTQKKVADMAQLVEQRIRNAWVPGSSPGIGSRRRRNGVAPFFIKIRGGISSVGRALASQAEGRGSESRIPLKEERTGNQDDSLFSCCRPV